MVKGIMCLSFFDRFWPYNDALRFVPMEEYDIQAYVLCKVHRSTSEPVCSPKESSSSRFAPAVHQYCFHVLSHSACVWRANA